MLSFALGQPPGRATTRSGRSGQRAAKGDETVIAAKYWTMRLLLRAWAYSCGLVQLWFEEPLMPNDLVQRARRDARRQGRASQRAAPEWNAVVVREGRARWRGARAFWLALAYASLLAAVLWWSYSERHAGAYSASYSTSGDFAASQSATPMDALGAEAKLGHDLFSVLCLCQVGAWLLLAPILTASSLSGERQKGLLDGLLLSRLSTFEIVGGKWASALGLILLLQLAGLPVLAVCFVMGGVSPGEFIGAFAIQLAAAACGAACGIASSACSRNNSDAAAGAIGSVLAWLVVTGLVSPVQSDASYIPVLNECALMITSANPLIATVLLFSPLPPPGSVLSSGPSGALLASGCGWMLSVLSMALLSAWLLRRASNVLLRSPERFDEPTPSRQSTSTRAARSSLAHGERRQDEELRYPAHAHAISPHVRPPGRWQMPILDEIVFGDAMMRRELTLLWRWPILSEREVFGVFILGLILVLAAFGALAFILASPGASREIWGTILALAGATGVLLCASRPASSIAREREGGLWHGLGLTLLSPLQIAGAKVLAPIVACGGYGSPAWLLLILAAWRAQIALGVALGGVSLVVLMWAQAASWSVVAGARARHNAAALGWGLAGPIVAWAGVPGLMSLGCPSLLEAGGLGAFSFLRLLHPFAALDSCFQPGAGKMPLALALHALAAAILFALAWRAVQRSQRAQAGATRAA